MKADPKTPKSRNPAENGSVVKKTISMPEAVFKKGEKAASRQSRTFSNYVATLISADRP